ncbi:hypothetical protein RclHR1_23570001 [Rhizophagus clarus]|uniref:Transcription regulator TrmB N-terminal domain-containing protein n=1 Tax=Rhizophagus clarus TaxID=94130 RepID=A0A2Z6R9R6_9GLOM|nr:hypothetical protein RclHR1_23570001 [Rhizophagus clarus]GES73445.1 hypothetical protein RCL_jg3939.t1 [Rhizophagus clarus]
MITEHEANRQAIQQLWNQGIQDAMEIHNRTNIPLSTIYDNPKKLKNSGTVQRIEGSGRPKKITANASRALGQYIRQDFYIFTRALSTKLSSTGIDVSYRTIVRHLSNKI